MEAILKLFQLSFWRFLLYGLIVISGLEFLFGIVGFLLSIPTDYGRIFLIGASAFVIPMFAMIIIIFIPIKILLFLNQANEGVKKIKQITIDKK